MTNRESGEYEPTRRIPTVDRQAVESLILNKEGNLFDKVDNFFLKEHVLRDALLLGFRVLDKDVAAEVYAGAGAAAVLLADSQPRSGGLIPTNIEKEVVFASLVSSGERSKGDSLEGIGQLFDEDKELFLGLVLAAQNMKIPPGNILQGGALLRDIYKHVLDSEDFGNKFPSIS